VPPAGFEPALPPPEAGKTQIMRVSGVSVSRFPCSRCHGLLWCPWFIARTLARRRSSPVGDSATGHPYRVTWVAPPGTVTVAPARQAMPWSASAFRPGSLRNLRSERPDRRHSLRLDVLTMTRRAYVQIRCAVVALWSERHPRYAHRIWPVSTKLDSILPTLPVPVLAGYVPSETALGREGP
jgi:hypothetical protein